MAKVINITSTQRGGSYADVVAFLTRMGDTFGNATNAAAVLLRTTDEYKRWRDSRTMSNRPARRKVV